MAEGLKIAFADRRRYMADPDRVHVPVAELTSKWYAEQRRAGLDLTRAQDHAHGEFDGGPALVGQGLRSRDGANTTHCTVIDDEGTIVCRKCGEIFLRRT